MRRDRWLTSAACRGLPTSMFFPERWQNASAHETAKKICDTCRVKGECLELALREIRSEEDRWGVFGGLTPHERWMERRRREREANG